MLSKIIKKLKNADGNKVVTKYKLLWSLVLLLIKLCLIQLGTPIPSDFWNDLISNVDCRITPTLLKPIFYV